MWKLVLKLPFDTVLVHRMNFASKQEADDYRSQFYYLRAFVVMLKDDVDKIHERITVPLKRV